MHLHSMSKAACRMRRTIRQTLQYGAPPSAPSVARLAAATMLLRLPGSTISTTYRSFSPSSRVPAPGSAQRVPRRVRTGSWHDVLPHSPLATAHSERHCIRKQMKLARAAYKQGTQKRADLCRELRTALACFTQPGGLRTIGADLQQIARVHRGQDAAILGAAAAAGTRRRGGALLAPLHHRLDGRPEAAGTG